MAAAPGVIRNVWGFIRRYHSWDRTDAEVLFSAAVTLAAIVGMIGLAWTIDLTRDALIETRKANDIAKRAAEAAEYAVKLDQRAWLNVTELTLSREPRDGEPISIVVRVVNNGRTPALTAVSKVRVAVAETPFFSDWKSIPDQNPALIVPSTVGTGFSSTELIVNPGTEAPYKRGLYRVWITGRITYSDIFNVPHWIDFCAFHVSGQDLKTFSFCDAGNSIDSNR